jgi:hypothetical protein
MSDTPARYSEDICGKLYQRPEGEYIFYEYYEESQKELAAMTAGYENAVQSLTHYAGIILSLQKECAELRKNSDRYLFWRDHVDPNDIQEMIMIDPADTDKTVDRYMQTWEERNL